MSVELGFLRKVYVDHSVAALSTLSVYSSVEEDVGTGLTGHQSLRSREASGGPL